MIKLPIQPRKKVNKKRTSLLLSIKQPPKFILWQYYTRSSFLFQHFEGGIIGEINSSKGCRNKTADISKGGCDIVREEASPKGGKESI